MGKRFKMERLFKFRKCVASKGLTGALFGCVARAEVGYENLMLVVGGEVLATAEPGLRPAP